MKSASLPVEPENPEDLAQKLLQLYQDAELCRRLGDNGRTFVRAHYNRQEIAKSFERLILSSDTANLPIAAGAAEDESDGDANKLARDTAVLKVETSKQQ